VDIKLSTESPAAVPVDRQIRGLTVTVVVLAILSLSATAITYFTTKAAKEYQQTIDEANVFVLNSGLALLEEPGSGPDAIETRLTGVETLVRFAQVSPGNNRDVVEGIAAFVRATSPLSPSPTPTPGESSDCSTRPVGADIQAALSFLGRRDRSNEDPVRINLSNACISDSDIRSANFADDILRNVTLANSDLTGALLAGSDLRNADLSNVKLVDANLSKADLSGVNLTGADLSRANVEGARLDGALLRDVIGLPRK
jgi:hypothetical protein